MPLSPWGQKTEAAPAAADFRANDHFLTTAACADPTAQDQLRRMHFAGYLADVIRTQVHTATGPGVVAAISLGRVK